MATCCANEFQERKLSTQWKKGEPKWHANSTNIQRNLINRSDTVCCKKKLFCWRYNKSISISTLLICLFIYLFFSDLKFSRCCPDAPCTHPFDGIYTTIPRRVFASISSLRLCPDNWQGWKIQFLNKYYFNWTIFMLFICAPSIFFTRSFSKLSRKRNETNWDKDLELSCLQHSTRTTTALRHSEHSGSKRVSPSWRRFGTCFHLFILFNVSNWWCEKDMTNACEMLERPEPCAQIYIDLCVCFENRLREFSLVASIHRDSVGSAG